jgi:hypothetical protein
MNINKFEEMLCKPSLSFEVLPRAEAVGGGWNLKLYEGKEEMGGGVFEAGDEGYAAAYAEGFNWQYQRLLKAGTVFSQDDFDGLDGVVIEGTYIDGCDGKTHPFGRCSDGFFCGGMFGWASWPTRAERDFAIVENMMAELVPTDEPYPPNGG